MYAQSLVIVIDDLGLLFRTDERAHKQLHVYENVRGRHGD